MVTEDGKCHGLGRTCARAGSKPDGDIGRDWEKCRKGVAGEDKKAGGLVNGCMGRC